MTKQIIIDRTIEAINELPLNKAEEISDFADFLRKKTEETLLSDSIIHYAATSPSFEFLNQDEDLYSLADLKVVYNAKR